MRSSQVKVVRTKTLGTSGGFSMPCFGRSSFHSKAGDDERDSYEAEDVRLERKYS